MKIRTGIGFDVHELKLNQKFFLGGIEIEHYKGSVGHSDGDTLIHAICDALLGAANLRDIGFHFPDTNQELKNIDSKILLRKTVELLYEKNWKISNIDSIIVLQKPKIKDYIPKMKEILAQTMKIDFEDISIKATTTEKLGFQGKEKGISAYATVLIIKD
jgi:2-C-methyl-D-erythritol 2,4-cyclodiphosphate synthase